jgi:uncharacterized protein YceH (UPF0502 family)
MNIALTPLEARLIGCLIEKEITTPDQYPLSLNALVNAANQKSNRDPLMQLGEREVQQTIDTLGRRHLVVEKSGFGSRVPKYQHRFCNTEYGTLKFTPQELACLCELMLRGPQTAGELRTRAARMAPFADANAAQATLQALANRADGPYVTALAREPGRRDVRYAQLFTGMPESAISGAEAAEIAAQRPPSGAGAAGTNADSEAAVALLEQRLHDLEERVRRLEERAGAAPPD